MITGAHAGDVGLFGAGAGGAATAVALIADLLVIARDPSACVPAPALTTPATITGLDRETWLVDLVNADRSLDRSGRRRRTAVASLREERRAQAV